MPMATTASAARKPAAARSVDGEGRGREDRQQDQGPCSLARLAGPPTGPPLGFLSFLNNINLNKIEIRPIDVLFEDLGITNFSIYLVFQSE